MDKRISTSIFFVIVGIICLILLFMFDPNKNNIPKETYIPTITEWNELLERVDNLEGKQ